MGRKTAGLRVSDPALEAIVNKPGNEECADCGTRGPHWASTNLGVLICMDCSGVHRSLGVHISKVKSLTLDSWQQSQIENLAAIGNEVANAYYESRLSSSQRSNARSNSKDLQIFIREKYERKHWARSDIQEPWQILKEGLDPREVILGIRGDRPQIHAEADAVSVPKEKKSKSRKTERKPKLSTDDPIEFPPPHTVPIDHFSSGAPTPPSEVAQFGTVIDGAAATSTPPGLLMAPAAKANENPGIPSPFSIDLGPPTPQRLQEAKVAAAKECIARLYNQPTTMGFGLPTYPVIIPEGLEPPVHGQTRHPPDAFMSSSSSAAATYNQRANDPSSSQDLLAAGAPGMALPGTYRTTNESWQSGRSVQPVISGVSQSTTELNLMNSILSGGIEASQPRQVQSQVPPTKKPPDAEGLSSLDAFRLTDRL